jgi:hypothetical protein
MEDYTSTSSNVPTNGDVLHHPLNQTTEQVLNGKVKRPDLAESLRKVPADAKAKIKPTDLFTKIFGGRSLTVAQILTHSFGDPVTAYPQQLVGLLLSRIKGAETRSENRKSKIQKLRVTLKNRVVLKHGKAVALTSAECKSVKHKKLMAEAELLQAKEELWTLRAYLKEAVTANGSPVRKNIKSVREMAFVKRMTPSISQRIIAQMVANPDLRESFLKVKSGEGDFLDVLKTNDAKTHLILLSKPKLATQVKLRVFEQLS